MWRSASYVSWWHCGTARICCCASSMPQSIDISWPPGPQQQTRRTLLQRSIAGTDRRTPYRDITLPHPTRSVSIMYAVHHSGRGRLPVQQSMKGWSDVLMHICSIHLQWFHLDITATSCSFQFSRSVNLLQRYGCIWIFNMAGVHHVGLLKVWNFNDR